MKKQMSESLRLGILLALSGGFLDAYTYVCRDGVFANAQTGNIVLFGINLYQGNSLKVYHYLFPILSFALGVYICEAIQYYYKMNQKIHWRQIIIGVELVILLLVSFIPSAYNSLANCLVSLTCALQVDCFRKVKGYGYATTMCTGNLRSGVEALTAFFFHHQVDDLFKAGYYFLIINMFIIGAILGSFLTSIYSIKAVLFCMITLLIAFFAMFKHPHLEE